MTARLKYMYMYFIIFRMCEVLHNLEKLLSIDLHATANRKYYVCTFSHYYFLNANCICTY